jgi:hypothetical protein
MDFYSSVLEAEVKRRELDERIARARVPKIPSSAHRHLLAQRLHRVADRIDN